MNANVISEQTRNLNSPFLAAQSQLPYQMIGSIGIREFEILSRNEFDE